MSRAWWRWPLTPPSPYLMPLERVWQCWSNNFKLR